MRKPEARIYQYTLEKLQVVPQETVFLDDLGHNLKAAKQLGIRTIKVWVKSGHYSGFNLIKSIVLTTGPDGQGFR